MAKIKKNKKRAFILNALFIFRIALIVFIIALSAFILYSHLTREKDTAKKTTVLPKVATIEKPKLPPPVPVYIPKAKVAIVIDDMGQDIKQLREILKIDALISIAVLPFLPHSKDIAIGASSRGREVLLHLPMEPHDSNNNPGKGAIFTDMTESQVAEQVRRDIEAVPFITGINNHMGSRFTEDENLMRIVLKIAKTKNLFFLDSKTTNKSAVYKLAKELYLKTTERQVFLDNEEDVNYIKGQVLELVEIAKRRGSAIGIGHPHPTTIAVLQEMIPMLNADVDIVTVSSLIDSTNK